MTYVIGVRLITAPSSQEHVIFENILHNRMFLIGFYTIALLHFATYLLFTLPIFVRTSAETCTFDRNVNFIISDLL